MERNLEKEDKLKNLTIVQTLLLIVLFQALLTNSYGLKHEADTKQQYQSSIDTLQITIPSWILNVPAESLLSIGVSKKTKDNETMIEAARQQAAILLSRNKAAISITNSAYFDKETEKSEESETVSFEHTASADTSLLMMLADSLQVLDHAYINDYYIGLFGINPVSITNRYITYRTLDNMIARFSEPIRRENCYLYANGFSRSADLSEAIENSFEKAQIQLSKYLRINTQSLTKVENDVVTNTVLLETTQRLDNIRLSCIYLRAIKQDNRISYLANTEIEMRKE